VADFYWKKMDMNSACTWSNVVKANPFYVVDFDWKKMDMNSACTWSNVVKANPFSFNI
jgi:hypothetical protein